MRSTTLLSAALLAFGLAQPGCIPRPAPPPLPSPDPPPSPTPAPDPHLDPLRDLLDAHNRERAAHGLPPFTHDDRLAKMAQDHADLMAKFETMTHGSLGDGDLIARYAAVGYRWSRAAENIAEGYDTVSDVMHGWMDSPGHRANILGPCAQMGAGMARAASGAVYWCTDFGTPAHPGLTTDVVPPSAPPGLHRPR